MKKFISAMIMAALSLMLVFSAYAASVLFGDVNGDGKVAANDARLVLRIAAKIDEADSKTTLIADLDGNGRITASDARAILRIAAKLDASPGSIDIDENAGGTQNNGKTEVASGVGMSFKKFMEKFVSLEQSETTNGKLSYFDKNIRVESDPAQIGEGIISKIIITGGNYSVEGIYPGMAYSDAQTKLEGKGWRAVSSSASPFVYGNGYGMLLKISVSDGKITVIEYYLEDNASESTTKAPVTEEPTTKEPTTKEEPTTKQEPTTKDEPTTKEPGTYKPPVSEPENLESLPAQLKAFIYGKFGFDGDTYSYTETGVEKTPVTVFTDGSNMSVSMKMEMEGSQPIDITVLMTDVNSKKSSKMYMIHENAKTYCYLDSVTMSMLGISTDDLSAGFEPYDIAKVKVSSKTESEFGIEYTVYDVSTDDSSYTSIYMLDGEITRIVFFQNGFQSGRIDVHKFYSEIPDGKFSLAGYKKKTMIELFGGMFA